MEISKLVIKFLKHAKEKAGGTQERLSHNKHDSNHKASLLGEGSITLLTNVFWVDPVEKGLVVISSGQVHSLGKPRSSRFWLKQFPLAYVSAVMLNLLFTLNESEQVVDELHLDKKTLV